MKISIWQQFASNHSTYFSVVGTFPSIQDAEINAQRLSEINNRVWEWFRGLSTHEQLLWKENVQKNDMLTPVETKIQAVEQISWDTSLLKFLPLELDKQILVRQRHVMVEQANDTWFGPEPLPSLLHACGATINMQLSESKTHSNFLLLVDISCQMPENELDATILYQSFHEDFHAYKNNPKRVDDYPINDNLSLPFDYESLSYQFNQAMFPHFDVYRNGQQLNLQGLAFVAGWSWSKDLDTMTQFLQDEGCKEISYKFASMSYTYTEYDS